MKTRRDGQNRGSAGARGMRRDKALAQTELNQVCAPHPCRAIDEPARMLPIARTRGNSVKFTGEERALGSRGRVFTGEVGAEVAGSGPLGAALLGARGA